MLGKEHGSTFELCHIYKYVKVFFSTGLLGYSYHQNTAPFTTISFMVTIATSSNAVHITNRRISHNEYSRVAGSGGAMQIRCMFTLIAPQSSAPNFSYLPPYLVLKTDLFLNQLDF